MPPTWYVRDSIGLGLEFGLGLGLGLKLKLALGLGSERGSGVGLGLGLEEGAADRRTHDSGRRLAAGYSATGQEVS